MGWKSVKDHYRIEHNVHVREGEICIGSPYITDIIRIRPDGTFAKRYDRDGNEDLERYQAEMEANPAKLRELIAAPDTFTASLPVFTEKRGVVIEQRCEKFGWPNATHCGELMYENTHFQDRAHAVRLAISNAKYGVKWAKENLERKKADVEEAMLRLTEASAELEMALKQ